jgi:cytidylate kinase
MSEHPDIKIVAIDGPSASGKSTVSKRVAEKLQYVYVDSGSFYRGITWKAIREGVDVTDSDAVVRCLQKFRWEMMLEGRNLVFEIDGENPGIQLRSEPVRERVAPVAAIPEVRAFVVEQLQATTQFGNIVMEGRDIGSVVFPATAFKYYLDADPEERARRRNQEIQELEGTSDVQAVMDSLNRRDKIDSTRKTAPLQIPLGATVINSTSMGIEEVVETVIGHIQDLPNPNTT